MEIAVGLRQGDHPTLILQEVTIVMPGVGTTICWECGGDGDWSKFHPEPEILTGKDRDCVACKGSGVRYVDAWSGAQNGALTRNGASDLSGDKTYSRT